MELLEGSPPATYTAVGRLTISLGGGTWPSNVAANQRLLRNTAAQTSATHVAVEPARSTPDTAFGERGIHENYAPVIDLRDYYEAPNNAPRKTPPHSQEHGDKIRVQEERWPVWDELQHLGRARLTLPNERITL